MLILSLKTTAIILVARGDRKKKVLPLSNHSFKNYYQKKKG
jgi:hypothetical protein